MNIHNLHFPFIPSTEQASRPSVLTQPRPAFLTATAPGSNLSTVLGRTQQISLLPSDLPAFQASSVLPKPATRKETYSVALNQIKADHH